MVSIIRSLSDIKWVYSLDWLLHAHIDQLFIFIESQSLNDTLKFSHKKVNWFYEMNNYFLSNFLEKLKVYQKLVWWNHEMTDVVTPPPPFKKGGKKKKKTIIKRHALFHPLPNKCIFTNCLHLKFRSYIL